MYKNQIIKQLFLKIHWNVVFYDFDYLLKTVTTFSTHTTERK